MPQWIAVCPADRAPRALTPLGKRVETTGVSRLVAFLRIEAICAFGELCRASWLGSSWLARAPSVRFRSAAPAPFDPNLDPGESVTVNSWPPLMPSSFPQAVHVGFHEFQADCSVNHVASDDPIVFPKQAARSHSHTFIGATTTNSTSTTGSLSAGGTSCTVPADHSSYWFPTMFNGDQAVLPHGPQIVYYKSGIKAYNTVRAFPAGCVSCSAARRPPKPSSPVTRGCLDGRVATATTTGTSPRTVRPGPTSSCDTRRPAAGMASTWTAPTTSRTWPTP